MLDSWAHELSPPFLYFPESLCWGEVWKMGVGKVWDGVSRGDGSY
jgi:hypothetical protein